LNGGQLTFLVISLANHTQKDAQDDITGDVIWS